MRVMMRFCKYRLLCVKLVMCLTEAVKPFDHKIPVSLCVKMRFYAPHKTEKPN